jgi:hypothetical protein
MLRVDCILNEAPRLSLKNISWDSHKLTEKIRKATLFRIVCPRMGFEAGISRMSITGVATVLMRSWKGIGEGDREGEDKIKEKQDTKRKDENQLMEGDKNERKIERKK